MNYKAPLFLFNAHLETIIPSLLRRVAVTPYTRERITTPDNDFLDLDWIKQDASHLVIISHGLEGSADRPYVKGFAKAFAALNYDVLAWNFRSCSGEMNKQLRFYHSGATDDLELVIQHCLQQQRYQAIYLIGFSLGGNLTLKYLGERRPNQLVKKAVVFSVPLDLESSCAKISQRSNWIYANRFLRSLKNKIRLKHASYNQLDVSILPGIKTLEAFDDAFTAPIHGFKNASHYYTSCSSIHFVDAITVPTLIVNAKNDPFLSTTCFPEAQLKDHATVRFETPFRGGHVGFSQFTPSGLYWSEERAIHFIQE